MTQRKWVVTGKRKKPVRNGPGKVRKRMSATDIFKNVAVSIEQGMTQREAAEANGIAPSLVKFLVDEYSLKKKPVEPKVERITDADYKLIELHDEKKMTFTAMAAELGMSIQGATQKYYRAFWRVHHKTIEAIKTVEFERR